MKTVTVLIGNSDNKLTQQEWALFVTTIRSAICNYGIKVHFSGGSDYDSPFQNACFVCEAEDTETLIFSLSYHRRRFKQESVAIVVGDTQFI